MALAARVAAPMTVEELRRSLQKGERVGVLDVRPRAAYDAWRIPGALRCDPAEVLNFALLPREGRVVVVGATPAQAEAAASVLRERGFRAQALEGGWEAWQAGAWDAAEVAMPATHARIVQVRQSGAGCLSYLVASGPDAIAIDPSLDAARYLELARARGWTIRHVVETQPRPEHGARARELADAAGATLSRAMEGAPLRVGAATLTALPAPGHAHEAICLRLDGRALFTGDTLGLDRVGAPEGAEPWPRARAVALHATLMRLLELPPETLVLPAHASAPVPLDGRPLVATLRQVRERVPMLALPRDEFVERAIERG